MVKSEMSMKSPVLPIRFARYWLGAVFDWALPAICPVTGEVLDAHGMISSQAWHSLRFISQPQCDQCGIPFEFETQENSSETLCGDCIANPKLYRRAVSAIIYDEVSRGMILKYKHGDRTQLTPVFVPWMLRAGGDMLESCDVIMPVPLHPFRLIKRKYNQSALLAAALAQEAGKRYDPFSLRRIKHTPPQGKMDAKARKDNVSKAFDLKVDANEVQDARVVLVDDVLTSGATVEACARVLYKAGAASVDVLTLARVLR